jgi:hypothetical protein
LYLALLSFKFNDSEDTFWAKSIICLENCNGIPTIVTIHGLDNLCRQDAVHWVRDNYPLLTDGLYTQKQQPSITSKDAEEGDEDGYDAFVFTDKEYE